MKLAPHPKLKPTGVDWLGDVPAHWEVDRIKWTTSGTVNGTWGKEPNGIDDLICIRVADFDRERFLVTDEPPTLRAVENTQREGRLLRKGDLLIEKSGGGEKQLVGCVVFFEHEFAAVCSNFVARMSIRPCHSARFWSYTHAALYSRRLNYPAIKQTTGIQNLDLSAYLNTLVGLPPEEEQHAIANFLDRRTSKIDTLVAKKRTLIERLKEKRTALISRTITRGLPPDAAGACGLDPHPKLKPSGIDWLGEVPEHWDVKQLRRLAHLQSGEAITTEEMEDGGNYPVYGGNGIRGFTTNFTHCGEFILIGRQGAQCGNINYASTEFWASEHAIVVSPIEGWSTRWIAELLRAMNLNQYSQSAAQPGLSVDRILALSVPVPPSCEQHTIANFIEHETAKISRLVAKTEIAIERLNEYRTALITAAVTGKINVRKADIEVKGEQS